MNLSARARDLVLLGILFGLPLLVFVPQRLSRSRDTPPTIDGRVAEADSGRLSLNGFDRAVLRVATFPGLLIATGVDQLGDAWHAYVALMGAREQADQLRRQNEQLGRDLRYAQRKLGELKTCRSLLRFGAERDLDPVGARVIGRSTSPFVRVLRVRLDRGAGAVRSGLAVVNAAGVVGRVGRVYGGYADLQLAVDPQHSLDVVVLPGSQVISDGLEGGARGLVTGVDVGQRYLLRLSYVLREVQIAPGDRVVTSGAGGVFPAGILVGTVKRVERHSVGLYQNVVVEPAVDFASLREVLVLTPPSSTVVGSSE